MGHIIEDIIRERREKRLATRDLLGFLLNFKDEDGNTLTHDQIIDNVIGVLFAAQDTTASILTWIVKYITDDQKLLQQIQEEHKAIYEANGCGKQPLSWAQTREMPVTHRVSYLDINLVYNKYDNEDDGLESNYLLRDLV